MDPKCSVIKEQHCTSQFIRFSTYNHTTNNLAIYSHETSQDKLSEA